MKEKSYFAYFGDHRCASTWFLSVIGAICGEANLKFVKYENWAEREDRESTDFIADINAAWEHRLKIGSLRGFHVIRDPRDIVVSAYFSHKYSHPEGEWLIAQRKLLQQASLEEGIKASIDFRKKQFQRMSEWRYDDLGIFESKYEMLVKDPFSLLRSFFQFLDLLPSKLSEKQLSEILQVHSFEKLTGGRTRGQENPHHHYRKGMPGDWHEYFSAANKQYFKERYGDLLIQLGYEQDSNW